MLTLRCTQKLLTRLKVRPEAKPPASTTKLGDWYANTFNLGRERFVLCVSEPTLLPVVVPAAGADLASKLKVGLRETLEALSLPKAIIDPELAEMDEVTFAKTANRVVLGSMNEFQFTIDFIRKPKMSRLEMGLQLANLIWGAIDYAKPGEAAGAALSRPSPAKLRSVPNVSVATTKPKVMTTDEYEEMVEAATVDAYGEAEQETGWHCMLEENLEMPFETEVLGVTVQVQKLDLVDLDIVAVCRRGRHRQTIPLLELPMPKSRPSGAEWLDAYRRWKR